MVIVDAAILTKTNEIQTKLIELYDAKTLNITPYEFRLGLKYCPLTAEMLVK